MCYDLLLASDIDGAVVTSFVHDLGHIHISGGSRLLERESTDLVHGSMYADTS